MMEWKVVGEKEQKNFNMSLLKILDRIKTLDQHNSIFLDEQKIKEEIKSKKNLPLQNE